MGAMEFGCRRWALPFRRQPMRPTQQQQTASVADDRDAILRIDDQPHAVGRILAGPDLKTQSPKSWKLERDPYLLETSVPGIFVAGDVRFNSVKRCASAVGEGSIAIQFVHQYLATL